MVPLANKSSAHALWRLPLNVAKTSVARPLIWPGTSNDLFLLQRLDVFFVVSKNCSSCGGICKRYELI